MSHKWFLVCLMSAVLFSGCCGNDLVEPEQREILKIRYSYYQPWLAGEEHCPDWCEVTKTCVATFADGDSWEEWVEQAVACPPEWPFGTQVVFDEQTWICKDRGAQIRYVNDVPWVDFLTETPAHEFGDILTVTVIYP